ncbi:MAG: outer membrane beta-barrel protein [Gemmatimonadetes bacterium]|nr:outer membrane beta-barrel protein [Gemmatimonadota bacterium]
MRVVCLAIACVFSPLLAEGQVNARLGGGPAMPIGDLADGTASVGSFLHGGLALPVDEGYFLLIEGHHSRFGIKDPAFSHSNEGSASDADRTLMGGNAGLLIEGIADPVGFYGHGGVGWVRAKGRPDRFTGRSDRTAAGEDADSGTSDHSFMFVFGLGVNLTVSDRVRLSLEARYNHARNVFDESAWWIPVTAFVVMRL